ncbi:hypothetical protein [Streptomyces sp. NPDC059009]|uniref:hypothetical protein n=1 Tax=Streptomyces sp. NPDC059009 TaxID=3346694 RepID=UPI0036B90099
MTPAHPSHRVPMRMHTLRVKREADGEERLQNPCELDIGFSGCTVTFTLTFNPDVSLCLCTNPDASPRSPAARRATRADGSVEAAV